MPSKRIGIYAGSFNPVHSGHIAFALQSLENANLDAVYFLPERRPRNKPGVEHFGHRVAMLKRAFAPHAQFKVLELVDVQFTIDRTLAKLRQLFPDEQLIFLMGPDTARQMHNWPNYEALLENSELVVGVRERDSATELLNTARMWRVQPKDLHLFTSFAADVSSREVREALYKRQETRGLLSSVSRYSNRHWLYVSLS